MVFQPHVQRKLWAWAFLETAQSLFLREVGDHCETYWQVGVICAAQRAGHFFEGTILGAPKWRAQTRSRHAADAAFRQMLDHLKGGMAD